MESVGRALASYQASFALASDQGGGLPRSSLGNLAWMPQNREFFVYHVAAVLAVCCQATSASILRHFPDSIPPALKMCWRLFWMAALQVPLAWLEWRRLSPAERAPLIGNLLPLLSLAPVLAFNYFKTH